jgi:hypothetical protein
MNKRSEIVKEILNTDMSRIRKKIKDNSDISFLKEISYQKKKQPSWDDGQSYIFKDAALSMVNLRVFLKLLLNL